ncbi:MAG: signal peptidase I [Anaerolineae bacterium]|nr:signal peptidase I [Anaerolineae bacterium]MDW8070233.1 signal peptidase I [Anaerolineae bacterium]
MNSFFEEKGRDNPSLNPYTPAMQAEAGDVTVAQETRSTGAKNVRRVVGEILETIVLTLVIFFVIQTLIRNFRVVGTSMEPNLHNGQYLIIDKISYRFSDPQVGDVVVFEPPNRPGEDYVKRIIGLPGQLVEIRHGQVFIDNKPLEEPYGVRRGSYSMEPRLVGPDEYFVLGDNRDSSSDSHMWGMLPRANIVGRAWISYWPPSSWGLITRDAPTSTTTLFYWLRTLLGLNNPSSQER